MSSTRSSPSWSVGSMSAPGRTTPGWPANSCWTSTPAGMPRWPVSTCTTTRTKGCVSAGSHEFSIAKEVIPVTGSLGPPGFSLVDEAWIPVLDAAGQRRHVSLLGLFEQAGDLRMIACELPTQTFAVLRLAGDGVDPAGRGGPLACALPGVRPIGYQDRRGRRPTGERRARLPHRRRLGRLLGRGPSGGGRPAGDPAAQSGTGRAGLAARR